MKTCKRCRQEKPLEEFGPDPNNPDDRRIWCRTCIAQYISEKKRDPIGARVKQWMSSASIRSKKRGLDFELDAGYLRTLAESTNRCPYCPKSISYEYAEADRGNDTPTLDRIRPGLGYTKQNVTICCWGCNNLKSDTPGARLLELGEAVLRLERERGLS